jgi:hypothetical protein
VTYNPPSDFDYGQTVTITVDAKDLCSPANVMAPLAYSFTTTPEPPDTTAPVITLLGANPVTLEVGAAYAEPGYTATDDRDGDISASVVVAGLVNHNLLGAYTLWYNVSDSSGNPAEQKIRTVNVVDTAPPVIALLGAEIATLEVGTPYVEPGYTATDNYDGDIAGSVAVTGSVNHATLGSYGLRYNVSDSSGNPAEEKSRTVNVVDTTPPEITLLGDHPMTLECGTAYSEPGYTATDNYDGDITGSVVVRGGVDHTAPGTDVLVYSVSDSSGNPAEEKSRTVNVVDTTPPEITLLGDDPLTLEWGTPYVEPGYTATDPCEGDLTADVLATGTVDHNVLGAYTLRYNVSDSIGNPAEEKIRTVNVADTALPVITLLGDDPLTLDVGTAYSEPGYEATDNYDGDITGSVTVTGTVDHTVAGTYVLHYNVSDSSGNPAEEKTRTANVVSTTPFEIADISKAAPGEISLTWASGPGATYTIWSCLDIVNGSWMEEATVPSAGQATTWTDPDMSSACKFYRVEME